MPSSGLPAATDSLSTGIRPLSSRFFMQSPKAPTPGSTIFVASRITLSSLVTRTSAPSAANAFSALKRLPTP